MAFVGVGVGFNLGAAVGYLSVNAVGVQRGLNQAESSFATFESKVSARSQQAIKAANAAAAATRSAVLASAQTTAKLNAQQQNVASATANSTLQIADSYKLRADAAAKLAGVEQAQGAKRAAAEQKAQKERLKTAALQKKIADAQAARARTADPAIKNTLNKQIGGFTRALNFQLNAAKNAERELDQVRKSSTQSIKRANAQAVAAVTAANNAQIASINNLRKAAAEQSKTFQDLAKGQGVAAKRAADSVTRAATAQITAIESLEVAERRLERAKAAVAHSSGAAQLRANTIELERAGLAQQAALNQVNTARRNQVTAEAAASQKLKAIHIANEKSALKEAATLEAAIQAETVARKAAQAQQISQVTQALTLVGVATAAALGAAAREFIVLDEQLHNIASISVDVNFALNEMKDHVLALGVVTGQAPAKLAKALFDVVSSGFDGVDALTLLDASAKAAVAGMGDVEIAGKSLTAVLNAYKGASQGAALAIEDVGHVSDVAFQAVKDGVFTFEELTSQQGDNLSIAAELGVTYEELAASYVVLTRRGNSLSESTTQINGILRTFIKPNEDLAAAIRQYGREVLKVSDLTGAGLVQQFGFGRALQFVEEIAGNDADALGRLFPNIRALRGQVALGGEGLKLFNTELENMEHASDGAGATQNAFAIQTKAVAFQIRQAKEQFRVAAIEIGSAFGPAIVVAAKALATAGSGLAFVSQQTHGVIGGLLGISVAGLLATAAIVRIHRGAVETIKALGKLSELGIFDNLVSGSKAFIKQIGIMIARMRAFIAVSSLARLTLIGGAVAVALGVAAFATYKLIKAHKKESEEVKKLTELYRDLNLELNSRSVQADPTRLRSVEVQKEALDSLNSTIVNYNDLIDAAVIKAAKLSEAIGVGFGQFMVDPQSVVGNQAKGRGIQGADPGTITALNLQKRLAQAKLSAEELVTINETIGELLLQSGINQDAAAEAVLGLVTAYNKQVEAGTAAADADEVLISSLQELQTDTNLYTSGVIQATEATDDLSDFIETAQQKSERYRAALITAKDALLLSTGATVDATDPLAVLSDEFGRVGDSASDMLLRLDSLRDLKLENFAKEGVTASGVINKAFLGLDLSAAQREALEVTAAMSEAEAAVAKINETIGETQAISNQAAQTQQLVVETIGTEADGYAHLQAMVESGAVAAEDYDEIKAAGIFLYNDSAKAIDGESGAIAENLIQLAEATQARNDAEASYESLSEEQQAFASRIKDANFLQAIQIVLMAQFLALSGELPADVPFNLATNFAEVLPGFAEFVNQTDILNGRTVTTKLSVRTDPALSSIEEVNSELAKTTAIVDQLEQDSATLQQKGISVPAGVTSALEDARQRQKDLQELQAQMEDDAEKAKTDFSADGLPGIPSDEDVKEAEKKWDQISDFFKDPSTASDDLNESVANLIQTSLDAQSEFGDLSDPIAVLQKQFGLVDDSLADVLLKSSQLGDGKQINFGPEILGALRLQSAIDANSKALADYNDMVDKSQQKQDEWNSILTLLDDTLGKQEDGYDRLAQLQRAGLVSEQEVNDAINAGLFLRDRANLGILEERARIAKSLPALADYVAKHDDLATQYDALSDRSKGFLAALEQESVQTALNTLLLLQMLAVQKIIPETVVTEFIVDSAAANPALEAWFRDIGLIDGEHNVHFAVTGGEDVGEATKQIPPKDTTANVDVNTTGEAEAKTAADAIESIEDKDVFVRVHVVGDTDFLASLQDLTPAAAQNGYSAGLAFDSNVALALVTYIPLIQDSFGPLVEAMLESATFADRAGYYVGGQFDRGAARGMIEQVGIVAVAARYVAAVMLSEMIKFLVIRSPSAKTAEIGEQSTLGFARGLLLQAPAAADAARSVARTAGEAMASEAANQAKMLADAGGLVQGDIAARQNNGFSKISGAVVARDLSGIPRPAIGAAGAAGAAVVQQTNHVNLQVDGAGDPELVSKHVMRQLHNSIEKFLVTGKEAV